MVSFWDLYATVYDSLPNHFQPYQKLLEQVVGEVSKYSDKGLILDAGCGTGNFSMALAKRGYDVIGIDYTEGMLKRANEKKKNAGIKNIELLRLDLEKKLAFPDNYFEGIISVHALYTMRDPELAIKEYYRILRPNGQFVLSELQHPIAIMPVIKEAMNRGGWREAIDVFYHLFILGLFNVVLGKRQGSGIYHYWSESELKEKLSKVGFRITSIKEAYTNNGDLLVTSIKI
jgi:ubiquinone/menaquinone biosynthesis C-methylase UbiE